MSQKSAQELQQMIEDLIKRVGVLEQYVPNVEKRVGRLEQYVKTVQQTLARKGIKAPTL